MSVDQGSSESSGEVATTSQDAQAATVSALQGNTGQASPTQESKQPENTTPPVGSGLANPFLEGVDPKDRAVVEKYIKDWDSGVTKRFSELHGKLEPWEKLGADPEQAAQAMQLLQMIDNEPETVLGLLQEALGENKEQPEEQDMGDSEDDPMASLPPKFREQFNQMQQVLEMLAGNHLEQKESQTHAQQDAELDSTLTGLKEKYGEFDEEYVLAKMIAGQEPEAAVKAFQKAVQGQVNARSTTPNIPAILGGGGAAPQQTSDIKKASSKDVRGLVANLLEQSNRS